MGPWSNLKSGNTTGGVCTGSVGAFDVGSVSPCWGPALDDLSGVGRSGGWDGCCTAPSTVSDAFQTVLMIPAMQKNPQTYRDQEKCGSHPRSKETWDFHTPSVCRLHPRYTVSIGIKWKGWRKCLSHSLSSFSYLLSTKSLSMCVCMGACMYITVDRSIDRQIDRQIDRSIDQ